MDIAAKATNRRPLLAVGLMPLAPQIVGSGFNIAYNIGIVVPMMTAAQQSRFDLTVLVFNAIAFPVAIAVWVAVVASLKGTTRRLRAGEELPPGELERVRRRVINLPWTGATIAAVTWFACVPVFVFSVLTADKSDASFIVSHLTVSFVVSGLIAVIQSFFLVEITTQRRLFPIYFRGVRADAIPGAWALSLSGRGWLVMLAIGVAPIVSLLLIILASDSADSGTVMVSLIAGGVGILFGVLNTALMHQLVVEPIQRLRTAVQHVARGDFSYRIDVVRADEFGELIWEMNRMIGELADKQRLQESFGSHVGRRAMDRILASDPGLTGTEREISVLFVDIRNFTKRCAGSTPGAIVSMLNTFLSEMVEVVEDVHGGMINKFLGDGFMALYGADGTPPDHAAAALRAGREMLARLDGLNERIVADGHDPIAIGVGIHTGVAIVGSIGSHNRLEYTAIGSTVNTAARVEAMTKAVGEPLLVTEATRDALPDEVVTTLREMPAQEAKGIAKPVVVFAG